MSQNNTSPAFIITKKRDGGANSKAEMQALIGGLLDGSVPDYQMSAWLMAAFLRGLSPAETADLTEIMAQSGEVLDLSALENTVDKHSTGGVGDKTSLVLAPMLAALGLTVAKMSGRGLGHTGGTIDKLESFPGWNPSMDEAPFLAQAKELGLVLVGQNKTLAPADGALYALRDVTGTVESMPLIASSIMSKKIASGAKTIVLDVKCGAGAFMKTPEDARALAEAMVDIGGRVGRNVRAVITDMNTPLGHMAGNTLEVREAVETLRGQGPADLTELCVILAAEALLAVGWESDEAAAQARARKTLEDGSALEKFAAFVEAQGGNKEDALDPGRLKSASEIKEIRAEKAGFVTSLDALAVGKAVLALGGGRENKSSAIDHAVGVETVKKLGEAVAAGDVLFRLHHNNKGLSHAEELLKAAVTIAKDRPEISPLVLDRIG